MTENIENIESVASEKRGSMRKKAVAGAGIAALVAIAAAGTAANWSEEERAGGYFNTGSLASDGSIGLEISTDNGETWESFNDGSGRAELPISAITDMGHICGPNQASELPVQLRLNPETSYDAELVAQDIVATVSGDDDTTFRNEGEDAWSFTVAHDDSDWDLSLTMGDGEDDVAFSDSSGDLDLVLSNDGTPEDFTFTVERFNNIPMGAEFDVDGGFVAEVIFPEHPGYFDDNGED